MLKTAAEPTTVNSPELFGLAISPLDMEQTVQQIEALIEQRVPSLIVTLDATALVIADENPRFGDVLRQARLRTADSVGIVWALKRRGQTVPQVSGVVLLEQLVRRSSEVGHRLYFLGAEPGVAEMAAERLRLKYPGCQIVGARHGYFPRESDSIIAEEIALTKPDILFVAMGMPRQEEFILATQAIIQSPIGIGVGGSFDVFSGKTKRAPVLFQRLKMEWLWRLMLNPTKLAKVKKLPKFVVMVLRDKR